MNIANTRLTSCQACQISLKKFSMADHNYINHKQILHEGLTQPEQSAGLGFRVRQTVAVKGFIKFAWKAVDTNDTFKCNEKSLLHDQ